MMTTRILRRQGHAETRRYLREALAGLRSTGFKHFRLIGRRGGRDCPACAALDGPLFRVDAPPAFPPPDCTCRPHGCRLIAAAAGAHR